jgi:tripartite-type tricarboxylate transporter receptor subunit TctC
LVVVASAFAQDYPARPIVMLVPFAAGGPTDTVARSLAQGMGKALKQTIVVENAVGAGGTIAPSKLKSATPDGYTIMLAHIGMSTAPALYRQLSFKPLEDFELIGQVVDVPMTLIGKKDLPPNDLVEQIDRAHVVGDRVQRVGSVDALGLPEIDVRRGSREGDRLQSLGTQRFRRVGEDGVSILCAHAHGHQRHEQRGDD